MLAAWNAFNYIDQTVVLEAALYIAQGETGPAASLQRQGPQSDIRQVEGTKTYSGHRAWLVHARHLRFGGIKELHRLAPHHLGEVLDASRHFKHVAWLKHHLRKRQGQCGHELKLALKKGSFWHVTCDATQGKAGFSAAALATR